MFPAPRGLVAWFTYAALGDGKARNAKKPIVAFDADGFPYVTPSQGKSLIRADADRHFELIAEATYPPYDALIPAGGWRIEHTADDGTTRSEPLVGWGARVDGSVVALVTDSDGRVMAPHDRFLATEFRIYHPEQTPEETTNEQPKDPKETPQ